VANSGPMNPVCARFAGGDFSSLAQTFQDAGFAVQQPLPGVLTIVGKAVNAGADTAPSERLRLLISVGVHGDETAPIEIMALLMERLAAEVSADAAILGVDLMLVIGNIDAIRQGKRFIDVDLNRLFVPQRSQFNDVSEAARADQLMAVSSDFFADRARKWHLDLHTAIRASRYPTFAIVPGQLNPTFMQWLGHAGVMAAVVNPDASVTYSSYTCQHLGAISCTAELGRIGVLGQNDLSQFEATRHALDLLLRSGSVHQPADGPSNAPLVFQVAQELVKHSDAFQLTFDGSTENFTRFAPHAVVATDGERIWRVGEQEEFVLFPNANVRIGLRAGLMVRKMTN
jgi:succinylglutamate desuccinylase